MSSFHKYKSLKKPCQVKVVEKWSGNVRLLQSLGLRDLSYGVVKLVKQTGKDKFRGSFDSLLYQLTLPLCHTQWLKR